MRKLLGTKFNYPILWSRYNVEVLGRVNSTHNHNSKHIHNPNPNFTLTLILIKTLALKLPSPFITLTITLTLNPTLTLTQTLTLTTTLTKTLTIILSHNPLTLILWNPPKTKNPNDAPKHLDYPIREIHDVIVNVRSALTMHSTIIIPYLSKPIHALAKQSTFLNESTRYTNAWLINYTEGIHKLHNIPTFRYLNSKYCNCLP